MHERAHRRSLLLALLVEVELREHLEDVGGGGKGGCCWASERKIAPDADCGLQDAVWMLEAHFGGF